MAARAGDARASPARSRRASRCGRRILVVDDDQDLRRLIAHHLRAAGYRVVQAADGRSALGRIHRDPPDLVLLDVNLPGVSGFEVLDLLGREGNPPPVIMLTARGRLEDRLRGLHGGAVDYIIKPFAAAELVARVSGAESRMRKLQIARIESCVDDLTGLGNRRDFDRTLASATEQALDQGEQLAMVCVDADRLKEVNDRFGHPAGDELLRAIARAIGSVCRSGDRPARIGGDEFAILLPRTGTTGAAHFSRRLRAAVAAERFTAGGKPRRPSASIGHAVFPDPCATRAELCDAADRALYLAKKTRLKAIRARPRRGVGGGEAQRRRSR